MPKPSAPLTIRALRERAKLTPTEIEARTQFIVNKGWLSSIERGAVRNPGWKRVEALAKVLGIEATICYAAISASVAAKAMRPPSRRKTGGRVARDPALDETAPPPTLHEAIEEARQLCATLERLALAS